VSRPVVALLDYGIGNLRSAQKALQRVGADARLTADTDEISRSDAVVLPGVGAFGRCVEELSRSGLFGIAADAAGKAVKGGKPFLGICVGLQLLYDRSEEAPGVEGLGVFPGVVKLLPGPHKRPQMQWNRLEEYDLSHPLFSALPEDPWFYFVHSYTAPIGAATVARCNYGVPICAAVAQESLWATQFHPEKSGEVGLQVLSNFVKELRV